MSTRVLRYTDPAESFRGWLVYDGLAGRIAAGGCRVQLGLTESAVAELASRMTLKQQVLGIGVDGAKCGIDYDPWSPAKEEALRRFLRFLRGELLTRFSMGCDMGTRFSELQRLARLEDVPSVKYAIKEAQEFSDQEFCARMALLDEPVGRLTLGERRAGHALAHVALAAARASGLSGPETCALQGFGNLGRAAACSLTEEGVRITAIADEFGCVADRHGLNVAAMLAAPPGTPVPAMAEGTLLPSAALAEHPCDILVLAAGADAVPVSQVSRVKTTVVVVGANCGLRHAAENGLYRRGILVIPDFIGGIGGSGSMEALFGPRERPSSRQVLDLLAGMMNALIAELTERARRDGILAREAAVDLATRPRAIGGRPYGQSRYLQTATARFPDHTFAR